MCKLSEELNNLDLASMSAEQHCNRISEAMKTYSFAIAWKKATQTQKPLVRERIRRGAYEYTDYFVVRERKHIGKT